MRTVGAVSVFRQSTSTSALRFTCIGGSGNLQPGRIPLIKNVMMTAMAIGMTMRIFRIG